MEAKLTENLKEVETLSVAYLVLLFQKWFWMRIFSIYLLYIKPPPGSAAWVEDMSFWLFIAAFKHQSCGINSVTEADVL